MVQSLSVLAVEDGAIIVASPAGERFRLPVDAALRSRLLSTASKGDERRLSPREIQAHVRSGLTAEQVAAMTGAPVAYVERFVGPVLAERAYVVESAMAVRLPPETEGARSRTFGAVMGERLDALAASGVRWTSAKEPSGWVLAVAFTADDVQHDARWRFDPKHLQLEPDNVEASTLSQQGVPAALTPRLRAIEPTAPIAVVPQPVTPVEPDRSRFDTAVFRLPMVDRPAARTEPEVAGRREDVDTGSLPVTRAIDVVQERRDGEVFAPRPVPLDRGAPVTPFRPRAEPTPEAVRPPEPLRRRRDRGRGGPQPVETAPQPTAPQPTAPQPTAPQPTASKAPAPESAEEPPAAERPAVRPRRGRTSMPSWDEIVFGRDDHS